MVPANLLFTWSNSDFTCLHTSLPILMQGVILCAGTHHVKGAAAVPAVLPAPTVLIPAFKLFCDGNTTGIHSVSAAHGPLSSTQLLALLLRERK